MNFTSPRFKKPFNMVSVVFLLVITCYFNCSLFAQQKVSLEGAMLLLEQNNIDLRQQKYAAKISKQELQDAKNALLPKLSLGANHNYNYGLTFDQIAGQLITGNRWTNSANANLNTQTVIFQGFALRNQIRDALLNLEANHEQARTLNRSLKLQLLQYFFTAVTNEALYSSSLKQLAYSEAQLLLLQQQLELGHKTLVDIALAESQVSIDEYNVANSMNNIGEAVINIKQLLNIPYQDSIELTILDKQHSEEYLTDLNINQFLSISQNPFIAQAEVQKRKAELGLNHAKNSFLPTLSFSGGYGTNYSSERRDMTTGGFMPFGDQLVQNKSLYLGLSLSAPLFDGFKVRSAKNKANLQLLVQVGEVDKVKSEQEKVYWLAMQELERSKQEYQVSQKQFESLTKAFTAMSERYEIGAVSVIEYAKALLDRNIAELKTVASKYTLLYAYEVISILGST